MAQDQAGTGWCRGDYIFRTVKGARYRQSGEAHPQGGPDWSVDMPVGWPLATACLDLAGASRGGA